MNKTLTRLFTIALLMMVSMGAWAEVKVLFGEKGTDKYEGKGGTIQVKQEESRDGGKVTVRLAFIPDKNYTFDEQSLEVYKVFSPESAATRALEIDGDALKLEEDKSTNPSEKHYHVDIDSKLALRVKEAQFINMRKSGDETELETELGTFFIANGNGYSSSNVANNFYLVPATNFNYATGQPHLTTSKTGQVLNSCWKVVQVTVGEKEYYRFIHVVDGKYLTANPAYSGTNGNDVGRLRVHLETMDTPDDNTLFERKANNNGGFNIRHKDMTDNINKSTTTYLDPAGGNIEGTNLTNTRTAKTSTGTINVGGGIGYWTDESAARWHFEEVPQNNTYTYNIVDRQGRIAIKYTTDADQPAAKALSDYTDIPKAIRSPYLNGETVKFYSFSGDFSADKLSDENKITATPVTDGANIYVTYTTDLLADRFVKLHGASAFNITVNSKCIYDDSGLTVETTDFSSTTTTKNHLWYFDGDDPYAVEIKNLDTGNLLQFDTTGPTLSVATDPTNKYFIIMDGSTSGAGIANGQMELMAATGDDTYYRIKNAGALNIDNSTTTGDASLQVRAYPVSVSTRYHLIDKAGKLIEGNIESMSSELGLPDEWKSPLVSEYHYYSTPNQTGDTYAPTGIVNSPFDATDIYVTYDVSDVIDIEGGKTYMLRYLNGQNFKQEKSDKILSGETKAVYPYNNGDFNLYVYGKEQWDEQVGAGASERSRWLWYIESNHNDDKLDHADPYHVVIKSYQDQKIKYEGTDYSGTAYLRTYKPNGYTSIVTGTTYKNTGGYKDQLPESEREGCLPTDKPTEYMLIGTSLSNVKLVTLNAIDDGTTNERRTVNSFEQYWKNNPTINGDSSKEIPAVLTNKVTQEGRNIVLTPEQKAEIASQGSNWHVYKVWAYSAPWVNNGDAGQTKTKQYHEEEHCLQTISMGTGEFTFEEVSLEPQVILLDNHGWEIVRIPMYRDFGKETQTINTSELSKYDSPMVETNGYHWYPKAAKVTGYHKYTISDPEPKINIYTYGDDPSTTEVKDVWYIGESVPYSSSSLATTPDDLSGYSEQAIKYKTDFYVTYTVKSQYANAYHGAATEDAVTATPYLLKQGGNYATYGGSGTTIATVATKPSRENLTNNIEWYLKPNFNIDREMGYKYAGETGAQDGALSQAETEADNYDEGRNGFDPYNVQIQNRAYPLRYFTANTTGSALSAGLWTGTSATVALQNMSTKQTAAGYDQTTLNITNATFMVVDDGNGNMRLMPRFDHGKVMQSFGTLATQTTAASAGDEGTGSQTLFLESVTEAQLVYNSDEITDPNGYYLLAESFEFVNEHLPLGTAQSPFTGSFTGIIDGQLHTISSTLTKPLVNTANGAIIRNVILDNVTISSGDSDGNTGAIACVATGATRIYNCGILSGTVSGTGYTGGLVGLLNYSGTDGARVINCYSYADITGGSVRAGIVGYNNYASKYNDLKTMVMNCMFYGDISTTSGSVYPIYGGLEISNDYNANTGNRLNNYNYFLYEAPFSKNNHTTSPTITAYNCALAAEERYLVRFEFYRYLLNSTRELASWYVFGSVQSDAHTKMLKWVLDKSIAPYPILKQQGTYPSVVNYDPINTFDSESGNNVARSSVTERNKGKNLGTLTVNISIGSGYPTGAAIKNGKSKITLQRTDKDEDDYNFNYDKVQLPYYNEVGVGNCTYNKVVTGWKITSITASGEGAATQGTFTKSDTWDGYNFADRSHYAKDLYSESGQVFSQGAYFDVPTGVTEIDIEPYWGTAAYLADANYDCYGYETSKGVTDFGTHYTGGNSYSICENSQIVYTSFTNALNQLSGLTVYDNAVVLVGNYHQKGKPSDGTKPFTIMSADLDEDNEPDYSFIYSSGKGEKISPIRFDFVNVPGTAMAHKMTSTTYMGIMGNHKWKGWLEVTNTAFIRFSQLEYDDKDTKAANSPVILLGGVVEQIVSTNGANKSLTSTPYIYVGSNVWFKLFNNGCHMDKSSVATPHIPISVTGGEYEKFYLSGYFRPDAPTNANDHAECYIDGGKFGEVAGAGQEKIDGNVTWDINNADIESFFGGGINDAKPVTGNIIVTIKNSHVGLYCGGPKFGNMTGVDTPNNPDDDKTVSTTAKESTFGNFYGAGYGGTAIYRDIWSPGNDGGHNRYGTVNYDWMSWLNDNRGYSTTGGTRGQYVSGKGIAIGFETEQFEGSSTNTVARLYVYFASLSVAKTNGVTSSLTSCTIKENYYGGGNLGAVNGNITSTLNNCTVNGSAFGAGCSATVPTADVYDSPTETNFTGIRFNTSTGIFEPTKYPDSYEYTWSNTKGDNSSNTLVIDNDGKWIHVDSYNPNTKKGINLDELGVVTGDITLNIEGNTVVMGKIVTETKDEDGKNTITYGAQTGGVFGGGDSSSVTGDTEVKINASSQKTTDGYDYNAYNVFGGGNKAPVTGDSKVTLKNKTVISNNVYGGGNEGIVSGSATVNIEE